MTRGCDVWVNVPRPPLEASGTSGMKSAINGGLQLSVLDGWWPEAYDGTTAGRSAARSTTTTARRTGATRRSSTGCSSDEVVPRSTTATPAACRRRGSRWCARRCARAARVRRGPHDRDYAARIYPRRRPASVRLAAPSLPSPLSLPPPPPPPPPLPLPSPPPPPPPSLTLDRRTQVMGAVAIAGVLGAGTVELARVWRRGSAPLPARPTT